MIKLGMNQMTVLAVSAMAALMPVQATSASAAPDKTGDEPSASKWAYLGKGLYRDGILTSYYPSLTEVYEWEVDVYESSKEGEKGLYKVAVPYKNCPIGLGAEINEQGAFYIHAEDPDCVYLDAWYVGVDWSDGPLMVYSVAGYDYDIQYGDFEHAKAGGLIGRLWNGAITFPPNSLLTQVAPDYETQYELWKTTNSQGRWRLLLPGAPRLDVNYTFVMEDDGKGGKVVTFDVDMQKDVEKVRLAFSTTLGKDALQAAIIDGSVESREVTESGRFSIPVTENGIYRIMAVPYYNGAPIDPIYKEMELVVEEKDWIICEQKGLFRDAFLCDLEPSLKDIFSWPGNEGEVTVQVNKETPGLIRICEPFGPEGNYAHANVDNYDSSRKRYMYFHMEEADKVWIEEMDPIGLKTPNGELSIWCRADKYNKDPEYNNPDAPDYEERQAEIRSMYGKLDGNTVTFPKASLLLYFNNVFDKKLYPHMWYRGNYNGTFRLVLPDEAVAGAGMGTTGLDVPETGEPVYYNLHGMRADGRNLTPGIYVRVCGGKSTKIVVR